MNGTAKLRKPMGRALVCLLVASLCACSFRPLYGTRGANPGAQALFSSIYVETDDTELVGYELRNAVMELMRCSDDARTAKYRLHFAVKQTREGVSIEPDAAITRYNYTLAVTYTLSDAKTAKVIAKGVENEITGFDVVSSPYSTLVGQQDAQKRSARDIAQRLQIDLAVFFAQHPQT